MESNLVCYHTSDWQNWTTSKRESNLSITGMITDRIGQWEVLLPINHNYYNFPKPLIHLGQTSPVEAMSYVQKVSPFWKFLSYFRIGGCSCGYCDKFLIGKFGWVDFIECPFPSKALSKAYNIYKYIYVWFSFSNLDVMEFRDKMDRLLVDNLIQGQPRKLRA